METAIGVFASRERAEDAVKELRQHGIPEQSIVFLTRSENEAKTVARQFGATVGGFMGGAAGMSAGVLAASLLLPGIGTVFALGVGGAALLGLAGASAGGSVGHAAVRDHAIEPTQQAQASDDAQFFREVLKEGRSLIVVRTESQAEATTASAILDRYGIGMQGKTPVKIEVATRQSDNVGIVDIRGRITVGEDSSKLRQAIADLTDNGHNLVLLNLEGVSYIDSSGLGELVRSYTTIRNRGGHLKLVAVNQRVFDLLQVTRLLGIFDIETDEAAALASFRGYGSSAVA